MPAFTLTPLVIGERPRKLAGGTWSILVIAICVMSLLPNFGPPSEHNVDKILHFLGYGAVAGLPFLAMRASARVLYAALAMAPLGIVLEILQGYVPGRVADGADIVANLAGVVAGLALGPLARRIANRLLPSVNQGP
jgi:VanZ family protein